VLAVTAWRYATGGAAANQPDGRGDQAGASGWSRNRSEMDKARLIETTDTCLSDQIAHGAPEELTVPPGDGPPVDGVPGKTGTLVLELEVAKWLLE
jgi:hypothetical protein